MKFLLFGTGEYYNRYKIWFAKEEIIALIDNSKEKQGRYIDDILVIRPEDIFQYEFDVIVILSFYVKAMKRQLMNLGVEESKIYHFFDLHDLFCHSAAKREIHYFDPNYYDSIRRESDRNRKVLLLSHDLTLGGPALALHHAAQVLVKRGYQAVFGSMLDGPLRRILQEEGIPVIIDENLMIATMEDTRWINEYSLVICNTMNFHVFLSARNKEIPVVWWLHDARFFYDGIRQKVMDKILQDNLQIWSVGPIPESAVKTFRHDFHVEDLLYGVIDHADPIGGDADCAEQSVSGNRKMRFITAGYIEHRKGQDILLEAIKCLEPDIRQRAEFFFVGENTSLLAKELIDAAKEIPEIVITGPVGREEIHSLFGHSDVLVCPSREDPMPTVAAEAMMHGVPCVLSDTTGTVKYIRDERDGMIFQSGNAEQLKEILANCIQGRWNLDQMGRNARKVFEKYFSLEAFEVHFMDLVERIEF